MASANYYSSHNQPENADPLYRACSESFSGDPRSAPCQWKVAWPEYLRDPASAASLFEEHLKRYPDSERASAALYFLGRIAESKSDWGAARVYYEAINNTYPNYYYAMLSRERLASPSLVPATRSAGATQFLNAIHFSRRPNESFEASAVTQQRIDRAHLLDSAGLDEVAEAELRFGAKADGQPQIMAVELAELANRRESPDQGIRFIKRYAPGYLSFAPGAAPDKFWRLAFPMPYRSKLEEYCRSLSLDPFLVAALIRQESEFNPGAVSRANAVGLMQLLPKVGKSVAKQEKMKHFSTTQLFTPGVNLQLGTRYFRSMVDKFGSFEYALAAYNAGAERVQDWLGQGKFRDPQEFVESIPFTETREYVQAILRNANVYRQLYGAP
jgi:soluble lytic murein transglycosylase